MTSTNIPALPTSSIRLSALAFPIGLLVICFFDVSDRFLPGRTATLAC